MPRRYTRQTLPPGFLFLDDYTHDDGRVTPGVASRLGITPGTYKKWRLAGKGPEMFQHGKRLMVRVEVVDAWLAGLGQDTGAPDGSTEHDARPPESRIGHRRRTESETAAA